MRKLTIPYSDDLLLSLKESPEEFETEARLLLAVKLYELGKVSTGHAAELAGISRVEFFFALSRFGLSPIGVDPDELERDLAIPEEGSLVWSKEP
jgi:predicted HTH domain antitoxin